MQSNFRKLVILIVFVVLMPLALFAEDRRTIPLDMYLIIDGSSSMTASKNDTTAWINERVVDRILADGDKITIWLAGDTARQIYSATLSGGAAGKQAIKDQLKTLNADGETADFSGALRDALPGISRTSQDRSRLSCTMLITGSAEVLEPTLTGNAQGLLRWFRSEEYERWQVLVVAPDIGTKVRQAGAAYMSSLR